MNEKQATRVLRFEVKPVCRDVDRNEVFARIFHASDELRAAMNRSMLTLIGLKLGTVPWPEEERKRGKHVGEVTKVPEQTLIYRLLSGSWFPPGTEPCYQPQPRKARSRTLAEGTVVHEPEVEASLSGSALLVAAQVLGTRLKTDWKDIRRGLKSAPTFKSVPLGCLAPAVRLHEDGRITVSLWAGRKNNTVTVRPIRLDGHSSSVLRKLRSGEYKLGNVNLTWVKPLNRKGKLYVNIQWTGAVKTADLDPTLWAGVDIGVDHLAALVVYNPADPLRPFGKAKLIPHPEQIMRVLRRRQRELRLRRSHYVFVRGRGRAMAVRGFGVAEDQISRVIDTAFRQAAADVIRQVTAAGAGNLVLEDHTNWSMRKMLDWGDNASAAGRARHRRSYLRWHQGLFAQRLREQGELAGLNVYAINPAWTSRTCSSCGALWAHTGVYTPKKTEAPGVVNKKAKRGATPGAGIMPIPEGSDASQWGRFERSRFRCTCGFQAHADVNAARNIAKLGHAEDAKRTTTEEP